MSKKSISYFFDFRTFLKCKNDIQVKVELTGLQKYSPHQDNGAGRRVKTSEKRNFKNLI